MHMASDMFSRSCRVVLELDGAGEPFSRVVCDVSVRCYRVGEVFGCTFEKVVGRVRCGRHGPVCFAPHDVLNVSTFTVGFRNRFALFLCRGTDAARTSRNSLGRSGCVVVVDL